MLSLLIAIAAAAAQQPAPLPAPSASLPTAPPARVWPVVEHDAVLHDFHFGTGETLRDLTLHYRTLGRPHRDAGGRIDNAVMVLHGTGGTGAQFLRPQFADELYGPGQPLDIGKYWIILPDNIGHGGSSKPSDGLRMKFPRYDYADMVAAQHRLLTETLGVTRMRLIMGTSMGCMHAFVWGETYPGFARALMPLACEPVAIAGLNRMWRQLLIDGIEADPAWQGGDYAAQPIAGLRGAMALLIVAGAAAARISETLSDARRRGGLCPRSDGGGDRRARRQRYDLSVRFVAQLRSVAAARGDRGADGHGSIRPTISSTRAISTIRRARWRGWGTRGSA